MKSAREDLRELRCVTVDLEYLRKSEAPHGDICPVKMYSRMHVSYVRMHLPIAQLKVGIRITSVIFLGVMKWLSLSQTVAASVSQVSLLLRQTTDLVSFAATIPRKKVVFRLTGDLSHENRASSV